MWPCTVAAAMAAPGKADAVFRDHLQRVVLVEWKLCSNVTRAKHRKWQLQLRLYAAKAEHGVNARMRLSAWS